MTYVEAKFGLRIRDSTPSDTGLREHSDPTDVGAVHSLSSGKGEGSSSPRDGCFKCGGAHFQRDCNASKSTGKQSSGQGRQSKSWSKSEGKGKSKENKRNAKDSPKEPKVPKALAKIKTSKTGILGLENLKTETSSETQESAQMGHVCTTDNSWIHDEWSPDEWNDGWRYDEWNDDWSSVGWHEGWEQTYDTSVSSFSLGSFDFGAQSSPKRFEWVKMNLDTGAAVNAFPLNFSPEGKGDGRFCEWIPDGEAWDTMKTVCPDL